LSRSGRPQPMTAKGHEDQFLPLRLSARSVIGKQTVAATRGNGRDAPLAAILVRAIDLASISAEEFVEKRIDFVILVLDRDPMRRPGELFEPISHASGL